MSPVNKPPSMPSDGPCPPVARPESYNPGRRCHIAPDIVRVILTKMRTSSRYENDPSARVFQECFRSPEILRIVAFRPKLLLDAKRTPSKGRPDIVWSYGRPLKTVRRGIGVLPPMGRRPPSSRKGLTAELALERFRLRPEHGRFIDHRQRSLGL